MTLPSIIWVLGAEDPEMQATEELLRGAGQTVVYATVNGERVIPRTAYQADPPPPADVYYFVECTPRNINELSNAHIIDHHRPGDPGFGKGPEEFLEASSLGQVMGALAKMGALPVAQQNIGVASRRVAPAGEIAYQHPAHGIPWRPPVFPGRWVVALAASSGVAYSGTDICPVARIPQRLVVAAAADHCLHHAWAGRCPGVSRDEVRDYRAGLAETRPKDPRFGRPESKYFEEFWAAVSRIETAPRLSLPGGAPTGPHSVDVADLRGQHVPELPDAACYIGVAYLATVTDHDGREKTVLGGATTPELVEAFMKVWAPEQGLTGIYGDPVRGFAGAYVP